MLSASVRSAIAISDIVTETAELLNEDPSRISCVYQGGNAYTVTVTDANREGHPTLKEVQFEVCHPVARG